MGNLKDISALIVESSPGMRTQLRNMLADVGISRVQFAVSASAAVRKLREESFDLILCEYHLGDGQDGQHLLEDLRHNSIIPLATLFIMVTGERQYERVMGAAELAPNDYILKPFAADTLQQRIDKALEKREAFLPIYRLIELGDLPEAIRIAEQAETRLPQYGTDLQRLRAELLLSLGRADEAQALYRQILFKRSVPWARLGLAKTLVAQKKYDAAEDVLRALISENEQFLDAYDLLARTREAAGRSQEARDALVTATTLSPHRINRLRHLGTLSLEIGDGETAARVLSEVVRKGKYSDFRDPEDHVRLVRAQIDSGQVEEAQATLRDLEKSMAGLPKTPVCSALSAALYHSHLGDREKAAEALKGAIGHDGNVAAPLSLDLRKDLARACFEHELEEQGSAMVMDILRNAGDEATVESTRDLLRACGRERLSENLEQRIHNEVKQLISTGAAKAQAGDYDGAVAEMLAAVRKMPGNTHVLFNAALALLRHIEHRGWNERFAAQARALITRVRQQDPHNSRLPALTEFLHQLIKRYGIHPGDGSPRRPA